MKSEMNPRQQEMSYCLEVRIKSKHPCVLTDILPAGFVKYTNSAKFGSIQPAVNETWHYGIWDQKICRYMHVTYADLTILLRAEDNEDIYNYYTWQKIYHSLLPYYLPKTYSDDLLNLKVSIKNIHFLHNISLYFLSVCLRNPNAPRLTYVKMVFQPIFLLCLCPIWDRELKICWRF